ncbi:chaperonin CPN60, mitochondrial-like [Homalodisca vitripennis]|uniref:chaperonin CPN60, mitochondrial-like n=1 Tax=Homalodisca vitripennis TaxID=197043 RepID=UPI001EE9F5A5|nr:chaperonin CPN60, mitochondrial-like [Homalodisca vitripennis]
MSNLVLIFLLMNLNIVHNNDGDGWGGDKVVWTKFNLIPKPVLTNFTKSFHSVFKNSLTTKAPKISAKLNQTISRNVTVDKKGLLNVTNERKVPMDSITLSSKVVGFPEDRTVPNRRPLLTSTLPPADARRRRRPVIRYEEESEEEEDDEDEDDEEDITDEFDVDDDDDDEDEEEEEVEVVEEVPGATIDIKHEYEDASYVEPVAIKKTKRIKKKSKKYLKLKDFKKLRKFMLPLLLAYKLKFFTLIPLLLGGLVLIVGTTGFAGFFFALFAVGLGLQKNNHG